MSNLAEYDLYLEQISIIVSLMIQDKYDNLVASGRARPSTSREYRDAVDKYIKAIHGASITAIPRSELEKVEIYSSDRDTVNKYSIDMPLWIDGKDSDLYAVFCVPRADDKSLHLYDIRVM